MQQRGRAQGESDGIDLTGGGQGVGDAGGEVGVGLRLVRLGGRAMAEEVDADHGAARVLQEGLPAGVLPGVAERPTPAVDEHHGFRAHERARYLDDLRRTAARPRSRCT